VEGPAWAPSGHLAGDWRCAGGWLLAASCGWRKPDAAADNGLAAAGFGTWRRPVLLTGYDG
jgi:hypothetical protein